MRQIGGDLIRREVVFVQEQGGVALGGVEYPFRCPDARIARGFDW
ncbi:MAG: hypothetical protein U0841_28140 [Chloroflexia bacterium]